MSSVTNRILDLSAGLGLYDRWARRHLGPIYQTLLDLAALRGGEQVLDVGCETGTLSSHLARAADGIVVCGIDAGPRMIAVAEKKTRGYRPRVEYRVGTAAQLPYADGRFDVVSSCLVFHLLQDSEKERGLREIFRVLKPGGKYVCAEFQTVPAGFLGRHLSRYPSDLIETIGFHVDTELAGPSITKHRPVVYQALTRPCEEGPGGNLVAETRA